MPFYHYKTTITEVDSNTTILPYVWFFYFEIVNRLTETFKAQMEFLIFCVYAAVLCGAEHFRLK